MYLCTAKHFESYMAIPVMENATAVLSVIPAEIHQNSEIFGKMPDFEQGISVGFVIWPIVIGVFLSLVVNMGPAFITLVQTSIDRGFKSAAWFAVGVLLNDAMIIALCILTSIQVMISPESQLETALFCMGAGVILLLFGIYTFRRKVVDKEALLENRTYAVAKEEDDKPSWLVFLGKGFALNLLNPFVWIFWFSAVAIALGNMGGDKTSAIVFFSILLATTLSMELLKAWGAAKLKVFFDAKRTAVLNKVAGVLLMLCGVYFIVRGVLILV